MKQIVDDIGNEEIASEIMELWLEYEEGSTQDAIVAKQLDKFEMIVQADEYEKEQKTRLEDFFRSTNDYFHHPEVCSEVCGSSISDVYSIPVVLDCKHQYFQSH